MHPFHVRTLVWICGSLVLAASGAAATGGDCQPNWQPAVGAPGNHGSSSLIAFDDGTGSALYCGGAYKWDGSTWSSLGANPHGGWAQVVFDDGSGTALYVGGSFGSTDGVAANNIARWNGTSWSAVGSGTNWTVSCLAVFDDGSGAALYAGGDFTMAGGVPANRIAKWDGTTWSALGSGANDRVIALASYDSGTGASLIAGGSFTSVGGITAYFIARWNGTSWSTMGTATGTYDEIYGLCTYDLGSGPRLFATGWFGTIGGVGTGYVAQWNGTTWSGLAPTSQGPDLGGNAVIGYDDGNGPAIYVGGDFHGSYGGATGFIARWNGSSWSTVGGGMSNNVTGFGVADVGQGPALFVAGNFILAGTTAANHIAQWSPGPSCAPGRIACEPGVGSVLGCPCGNPPAGPGRGCNNSQHTGGARLMSSGMAHLSQDTLQLNTVGQRSTGISIVSQGSTKFSAGVVFGQGVRCAGGQLKRLYAGLAVNGGISAPTGGNPSVSVRSAALGDAIPPGSERYYYVYYRDGNVVGGCPAASSFNVTQQLDVTWAP